MAKEFERKFLIYEYGVLEATAAFWEAFPWEPNRRQRGTRTISGIKSFVIRNGVHIAQGYVPLEQGLDFARRVPLQYDFSAVEARVRHKLGAGHYFALKGDGTSERDEAEARMIEELFNEAWPKTKGKRVYKARLEVPYFSKTLEVDVFTDRNLILAEIEVASREELERLVAPGKDVTDDKRYKNKNLAC